MHYLRLFHGRKDPDQSMDDWGENGPYIGPLDGFGWTYGNLRVFDKHGDDFEFLSKKMHDDMILHDGMYYGDIEFIYVSGWEEAVEYKDAISFEEFFGREGDQLIKNK